ncbi:MAG: hypothetical protein II849_07660 [Bacteroidales bacterium]|nr:hypothetical protein [Bacteroidales bacterium]
MEDTKVKQERYGRYIVQRYIMDSTLKKGTDVENFISTAHYSSADLIYSFANEKPLYAMEIKVRNKEYPTYIYEPKKDKGLQEYKQKGHRLIYANVIEETGKLYVWDVSNVEEIKGVKMETKLMNYSTYDTNEKVEKNVYWLPVESALINADVSTYIKEYKQLTNADN